MKHIIVAIPAYNNSVKLATCVSLIRDCAILMTGGYEVEILDSISGAEIDTIRNKMVSYLAAHPTATDLVMVDDDVCWSDNGLLRLLAAKIDCDRDIIGGLYPKRADPIEYPFLPEFDDGGNFLYDPDNQLLRCEHVPSGFMRVPKGTAQSLIAADGVREYAAVYNTVEPKGHPCYSFFEKHWSFNETTGEQYRSSEDVSFCKLVKSNGGMVYAHPDFSMGHIGDKLFLGSKLRGNSSGCHNEVAS